MTTDKPEHPSHDQDFLAPGDRRDPDYKDRPDPTSSPVSGLRLAGLF
jgi:sodium-dependent dicarboxylate transporter 2/3/5